MPADSGSWSHAAVRLVFLESVSDRVSTRTRRGDITSELQPSDPCVNPAAHDMHSRSIEVGLVIVLVTATMAWNCLSALRSHFSSDSMCSGETLPACRWICMEDLGASLVDPKLVLG